MDSPRDVMASLVAVFAYERPEHRSSIAPSPLAGEGWDGRESGRIGAPIDYLTDVLASLLCKVQDETGLHAPG